MVPVAPLGFLLGGNAITDAAVGRLSLNRRQQQLLFGASAVGATVLTGCRTGALGLMESE